MRFLSLVTMLKGWTLNNNFKLKLRKKETECQPKSQETEES